MILIFTITTKIYAAACCGGSLSRPSIIVGDEKYKLSLAHSQNHIDRDVNAHNLWKRREHREILTTYQMDLAFKFKHFFSLGASIPFIKREKIIQNTRKNNIGIADVSLNLAYQFLPLLNYHPIRPQAFVYLSLGLPTGKSLYEDNNMGLDTRGRNQWNTGIGLLLLKTVSLLDVSFNAEIHRTLKKKLQDTT